MAAKLLFLVVGICLSIGLVSALIPIRGHKIRFPSSSRRVATGGRANTNEADAVAFLAQYDTEYAQQLNKYVIASWNYETNLTDYNANVLYQVGGEVGAYYDEASANASQFDATNFSDDTKRQLALITSASLSNDEMNELYDVLDTMGRTYGEYQACRANPVSGDEECMYLEPELTELMAMNGNYDDHLWAWQAWHDGIGTQFRPLYIRYVELKNKLAQQMGYADYGDEWRQKYETTEMETIVQNLYDQVEPLYKQLHAFMRRKLYEMYGADKIDLRGPLPAHLLSDMWGRFWINLNEVAQPYPDKPSVDPTPEMIKQNYTARRMFEMGNEFYVSMGLKPVPDTFFERSMIEKPTDRDVVCHATAWDFYDGKDYRIRMCSRVVFEDFLTVHHELGHIQYYQQYADQPLGYQEGANDGFHEAVGELMAMSVATTKHLNAVGLLDVTGNDPDVDINFLLQQALNTISTLPFHLVQDQWRWRAFRGDIPVDQWNTEYWAEKLRVVGVAPPVARTEETLDIAALFHVCSDYDMIRYFMRTFYQYQFNEVLCNASGHTGPLHQCDFYGSTAAGDALGAMLKLGSSKPWFDAMEAMTGQRDVLATPLLNYFEPLRVWLEAENAKNNEFIGWEAPAKSAEKQPHTTLDDAEAAKLLAPLLIEALNSLRQVRLL